MELICPAGTPASFREAVDAGADAVYCGFRDETNARNFPGLNFDLSELKEAIAYARARNVKTFVALNTFMTAGKEELWYRRAGEARQAGADALIVADFGLMAHVAEQYPDQRLHISVQASASNPDALTFLAESFGATRVVLPRTLTIQDIAKIAQRVTCELEVFVFGGLCVMAEGRCSLSSYATGKSPNMNGVCSPASHVRYRQSGNDMISDLGGFTINRFQADEAAGYPTLCKGRFQISDSKTYAFEDPVSLDVMDQLDELRSAGVKALKVEGRQRGKAYIAEVVSTLRATLKAAPADRSLLMARLRALSEGQQTTHGAYEKRWR
ncbi:U32 family peptidase (plasmid) [Rhizobium grahamii]|uniref:Ubiquinone biosynthesis protein UbiU n=1 Tax=Rhizobium grahamii TaxID=1120045 RepID=A0A5Q0CF15_9HYPH|nr:MULTISPECIES: peptidase U32 family protein [Rhizobium]QFY62710.1 U32 family peptidase [Rhizobium grahamii]QRM52546.1 U32 family peptidase [Rhizobium sp. BG6]